MSSDRKEGLWVATEKKKKRGVTPHAVIPACGRVRQEDCRELESSLGYVVNSRQVWAGCRVNTFSQNKADKKRNTDWKIYPIVCNK